jgi:AcrR family transcriptional regulator
MTPVERPPLSRDAVVRAAVGFVDEHGLQALTMRRLGELLGVEAMSIYHYVNGREDLLEAVVGHVVDAMRPVPQDRLAPGDGWQAFLQHMAHGVRRIALAHPHLFPLIATRPPSAPWLRPPLRSLEIVEDFLAGLTSRGLDDQQAVRVYKVFTSFVLGHLLLEVAERGAATGPLGEPLDEGDPAGAPPAGSAELDRFPTVQRLERLLRRHDADSEFEVALEALLDRLERELSG